MIDYSIYLKNTLIEVRKPAPRYKPNDIVRRTYNKNLHGLDETIVRIIPIGKDEIIKTQTFYNVEYLAGTPLHLKDVKNGSNYYLATECAYISRSELLFDLNGISEIVDNQQQPFSALSYIEID